MITDFADVVLMRCLERQLCKQSYTEYTLIWSSKWEFCKDLR